jgi:hypothetical protein
MLTNACKFSLIFFDFPNHLFICTKFSANYGHFAQKKAAPRIRGRYGIIKSEINYLQPLLDVFTPSSLLGPPKV